MKKNFCDVDSVPLSRGLTAGDLVRIYFLPRDFDLAVFFFAFDTLRLAVEDLRVAVAFFVGFRLAVAFFFFAFTI